MNDMISMSKSLEALIKRDLGQVEILEKQIEITNALEEEERLYQKGEESG